MMSERAGLSIAIALFLFVLAIVWIMLPFAIFGTKRRLDQLIGEMQKANIRLNDIVSHLEADRRDRVT
jgi:hypothetical protein